MSCPSIALLLVTAASAFGTTNNGIVAFFPMRADGTEATSRGPGMQLTNAPFVHGALYLNGVYEHRFLPLVPDFYFPNLSFLLCPRVKLSSCVTRFVTSVTGFVTPYMVEDEML